MKTYCKQCNNEIEKFPSQIGKFCSKSCYTQSMKGVDLFNNKVRGVRPQFRVQVDCKVCGKSFEIVPSRKSVRTCCSIECHKKMYGVLKNTLRQLRDTIEYKAWRLAIYKRDAYKCQSCGQIGKNLHAHHVIPMSVDLTKSFDLSNGITLCADCHRLSHKSYKPKCKERELLGNLIEAISSQARRERLEGSQTKGYGPERTMNPHECARSKDHDIVGAYEKS